MQRKEAYKNQAHGRTGSQTFYDKAVPFQSRSDIETTDETDNPVEDFLDSSQAFWYDKEEEKLYTDKQKTNDIQVTTSLTTGDTKEDEVTGEEVYTPAEVVSLKADSVEIQGTDQLSIHNPEGEVTISGTVVKIDDVIETPAIKVTEKEDGSFVTTIDENGVVTDALTSKGDVHIKGNLYVDGTGKEIVSTQLEVASDYITLRKNNPSPIKTYAGVVTEKYDGSNDSGLLVDSQGVVRVGDVAVSSRVVYKKEGVYYSDKECTTVTTVGTDETAISTGNYIDEDRTIEIVDAVTITDNGLIPLTGRAETITNDNLVKWDANNLKLVDSNHSLQDFVQQVTTMPVAGDTEWQGKSVVYIGTDDSTYSPGIVYLSVRHSTDGIVSWSWQAQTVPIRDVVSVVYPVGSLYFTSGSVDPNNVFPGTEWEEVYPSSGYCAIGISRDHSSGSFTGNQYIQASQVPAHQHKDPGASTTSTGSHTHMLRTYTKTSNDGNYGVEEGNGKAVNLGTGSNIGYFGNTSEAYNIIEGVGSHNHVVHEHDLYYSIYDGSNWRSGLGSAFVPYMYLVRVWERIA